MEIKKLLKSGYNYFVYGRTAPFPDNPHGIGRRECLGLLFVSGLKLILAACGRQPSEPSVLPPPSPSSLSPKPTSINQHVETTNSQSTNFPFFEEINMSEEAYAVAGALTVASIGQDIVEESWMVKSENVGNTLKPVLEGRTTTGLKKYVFVEKTSNGHVFYKFYGEMTAEELAQAGKRAQKPSDPTKYVQAELRGLQRTIKSLHGERVDVNQFVQVVERTINGKTLNGVKVVDLGVSVQSALKSRAIKAEEVPAIALEAINKVRAIAQETGLVITDLNPKNVRLMKTPDGGLAVNIIDFEKVMKPKQISDPKAYVTALKRLYMGLFSQAVQNKKMPLDLFLKMFVEASRIGQERAFAIQLAQSLWKNLPKYAQGKELELAGNTSPWRLRLQQLTTGAKGGLPSLGGALGKLGITALVTYGVYETFMNLSQSHEFLPADVYVGYGTSLRYANYEPPYDVLARSDCVLLLPWQRRMDHAQIPSPTKTKGKITPVAGKAQFSGEHGVFPTSLEIQYLGDLRGEHRIINSLTGTDITDQLVPGGAPIPVLVTSYSLEPVERTNARIRWVNVYRMYAQIRLDKNSHNNGDILISHPKIDGVPIPELVGRQPIEMVQ